MVAIATALLLAAPTTARAPTAPALPAGVIFHEVRLSPVYRDEVYVAPPTAPPVDPKAYALEVLGPKQFACLDAIVLHESHWRVNATNRSSGAYGIAQALPASKMAVVAPDWRTNGVTQVRWMLGYIHGRYGTACSAWAFWQANRWY